MNVACSLWNEAVSLSLILVFFCIVLYSFSLSLLRLLSSRLFLDQLPLLPSLFFVDLLDLLVKLCPSLYRFSLAPRREPDICECVSASSCV